MRVVLFKARDGWRIRTQWRNGLIFATTEAYFTKGNAERAARKACLLMGVKSYYIVPR